MSLFGQAFTCALPLHTFTLKLSCFHDSSLFHCYNDLPLPPVYNSINSASYHKILSGWNTDRSVDYSNPVSAAPAATASHGFESVTKRKFSAGSLSQELHSVGLFFLRVFVGGSGARGFLAVFLLWGCV
jgi:hypothetical protein